MMSSHTSLLISLIWICRSRWNKSDNFVFFLFLAIGFSLLSYILAMGAISSYFAKYYHVAASIVTTAVPLSLMFFAPVTQLLTDAFGWRGAMLLLAAIQFHTVAAAAALRPINQNEVSVERLKKPKTTDVIRKYLANIFKVSLIRNRSFAIIAIIHVFLGYAFNGWLVYLVSIALSKGLTPQDAANIVLISGIGILIVRIVLTFLPTDKFSRHLLYTGSATMTLAYVGMYWTGSFVSLSIPSCLLGIGYGVLGTQLYIAMNACVGEEDIVGAVAWSTLLDGIAYFAAGYVTGKWLFTSFQVSTAHNWHKFIGLKQLV